MKEGLVMVYTGDADGRTSVVLGQVFRSLGRGLRVGVVHFGPDADVYQRIASMGGFEGMLEIPAAKGCGVHESWRPAADWIASDRFDLVVLADVTQALERTIVSQEELLSAIENRPDRLHVILTCDAVPAALLEAADLVTDVVETKTEDTCRPTT